MQKPMMQCYTASSRQQWLCLASALLLLSAQPGFARPSTTGSDSKASSTAPTAAAPTAAAAAATAATAAASSQISNVTSIPGLPLQTTPQLALIFPLKSLPQAPTTPSAYSSQQMRQLSFTGGEGYIIITKNDFGALGVLTEMMYLPGKYQTACSSGEQFYSVQRMWVDMQVSQAVGRALWGFPKDLATFTWGPQSVTAKTPNGKVIFSASFSGVQIPGTDVPMPAWFSDTANGDTTTIQFPISNALTRIFTRIAGSPSADVVEQLAQLPEELRATIDAAVLAASAHAAAGRSSSQVPNTQHLAFIGHDSLALTKAVNVNIDSYTFTGRRGMQVALADGQDVGFISGSPGALDMPVAYRC